MMAASDSDRPTPTGRSFARRHPVALFMAAVAALLAVAFAVGERAGWPFLSKPVAGLLSKSLQRQVDFFDRGEGAGDASQSTFRVRLWGGVRARSDVVQVAAPAWSKEPYTFRAQDAELTVAYHDLWRVYRGHPLKVEGLVARHADIQLQRLPDGRASWQFGDPEQRKDKQSSVVSAVSFDELRIDQGKIKYVDAIVQANIDAQFSLNEGAKAGEPGRADGWGARGLTATAQGRFRNFPMKASFAATRPSAWFYPSETERSPVEAALDIGRVKASYRGDAGRHPDGFTLKGQYDVAGPSLSAVGDALGLTLPTTDPFEVRGGLAKGAEDVWSTVVHRGQVGTSDLTGALVFDRRPDVPLLKGQVNSKRLMLADLAPTVGGATQVTGPSAPAGKVIPVRPFDLPSLRAMNANVLLNFRMLDLNTSVLEPIEPLNAHLVLHNGILRIKDVRARTASGQVLGHLALQAQTPKNAAQFNADLAWKNVQLQRFIKVQRAPGQPPYVSGNLEGRALLKGSGRSSADILSSLHGTIQARLREGTVSHLLVEGAGLDLAQAVGVLFKGDDSLAVPCALADFDVDKGVMTPRMLVVDSQDSGIWLSGQISLAEETLQLKAVVAPKDFSFMTVRAPIHVTGTFADPKVALEKKSIIPRVLAAAALAAANPLAGLIPLLDPGNRESAEKAALACRSERLQSVKR